MIDKGSPILRFNLTRVSHRFMWMMITISILSFLALWWSLDSTYGTYTTSSKDRPIGFTRLFRELFEDTKNQIRQHRMRTHVGGITAGRPSIVCPELDIPGSKKNVTIDLHEIDLLHVEEEIFGGQEHCKSYCSSCESWSLVACIHGLNPFLHSSEYLLDVRKFSSDVNQDVASVYRDKYKASEQGLLVKDVLSEGIKIGDDYWYLPGGHWIPAGCTPRWKVAIIIPFRNRFTQLPIFLRHLVPFLKKQYLEFGIFFAEQANELEFNRAMLMNVGYLETLNFTQWDCFIFHDVDHIPLSYGNYYGCSCMPKHFISGDDIWDYKILYNNLFGGVTGFTRTQVAKFNGFPNVYWGWGGEDDDVFRRMKSIGMKRTRPLGPIGWYNVIPHRHESAKPNKARFCLLRRYEERLLSDGLSNLKYESPTITLNPLYTNISVNIQQLPWNDTWQKC